MRMARTVARPEREVTAKPLTLATAGSDLPRTLHTYRLVLFNPDLPMSIETQTQRPVNPIPNQHP